MLATIEYKTPSIAHWADKPLRRIAARWISRQRRRLGAAHERSSWWSFIHDWRSKAPHWLAVCRAGRHHFSPLIQYRLPGQTCQCWCYLDRLVIHLLLQLIKPTIKHMISPVCVHLSGPSVIRVVLKQLNAAVSSGRYHYVLRLDIRGYYATIQHDLLIEQLTLRFDDLILRSYLSAIVTTGIDDNGTIRLPKRGIPRGSALSPFFGAVYLSSLDEAFANKPGIFYRRYMDDVIILIANARGYRCARKRLFNILRQLRLQLSAHKSRMGKLAPGFHFLGASIEVPRSPQSKPTVLMRLHSRTCRRALTKASVLREDAVHPAQIQGYLGRWATWWHCVIGLTQTQMVYPLLNKPGAVNQD